MIVPFNEGWELEIKAKAIDTLIKYLEEGFTGTGKLFNNENYMNTYT